MVLLPLVCSQVDVPVIAAGGICDGRTMAAAFALGAEGVQMGTRMVSAAESPVHDNYKQLVVDSAETGTVFLNRFHKPSFRVLATPYSEAREQSGEQVPMASLDGLFSLYFGGDLDAAFAFGGQVAGRIDTVKPVAQIIEETIERVPRHPAGARGAVRVVNDRLPALDGLRVLERSEGIAGAYAGKLLRDHGRRRGEAGVVAGRRPAAALVGGDARRTGRRHRRALRVPQRRQGERHPTQRVAGWADVVVDDRGHGRAPRNGTAPDASVVTHRAVRRRRAPRRHAGVEFTLQAWCGLMSGCGTRRHAAAADGHRGTASGPRARWRR